MHSLEGDECVVDVEFALDGDALAVTRLVSGCILYSLRDRSPLMKLSLPDS